MLHADRIVLLDTAQYSRQSFQNRTLIRNPDGVQWLTVPVVGGQFGESIMRTRIDASSGWFRRHDKALRFNYSSAPFFQHFRPCLDGIPGAEATHLGELTCHAMEAAAHLLGCDVPMVRASAVKGRPSTVASAMDGFEEGHPLLPGTVQESVDAPGSVVCTLHERAWRQNFDGFVSGTGSLDLLFNLGPDARRYLLENSLLRAASAG